MYSEQTRNNEVGYNLSEKLNSNLIKYKIVTGALTSLYHYLSFDC